MNEGAKTKTPSGEEIPKNVHFVKLPLKGGRAKSRQKKTQGDDDDLVQNKAGGGREAGRSVGSLARAASSEILTSSLYCPSIYGGSNFEPLMCATFSILLHLGRTLVVNKRGQHFSHSSLEWWWFSSRRFLRHFDESELYSPGILFLPPSSSTSPQLNQTV